MGRPAPVAHPEEVRRSSLLPAHPAGGLIGCMRSPVRMAAGPTALRSSTPMAGSTAQPRAEALGDGVLFGLSPAGNILPSVFSNWMETLLYSFTGGSDGANPGGSLVLDSSGNIYGSAAMGGANNGGTLYEFTNGGLQVLHTFPGFPNDGLNPAGVVRGSNGLYGITGLGGTNGSGTLYTTAGGYQVLHNFMSGGPEGNPTSLAADQAGNLYGTANYSYFACTAGGYNQIFGTSVFQASPPDWNPSILKQSQKLRWRCRTRYRPTPWGTSTVQPIAPTIPFIAATYSS